MKRIQKTTREATASAASAETFIALILEPL